MECGKCSHADWLPKSTRGYCRAPLPAVVEPSIDLHDIVIWKGVDLECEVFAQIQPTQKSSETPNTKEV